MVGTLSSPDVKESINQERLKPLGTRLEQCVGALDNAEQTTYTRVAVADMNMPDGGLRIEDPLFQLVSEVAKESQKSIFHVTGDMAILYKDGDVLWVYQINDDYNMQEIIQEHLDPDSIVILEGQNDQLGVDPVDINDVHPSIVVQVVHTPGYDHGVNMEENNYGDRLGYGIRYEGQSLSVSEAIVIPPYTKDDLNAMYPGQGDDIYRLTGGYPILVDLVAKDPNKYSIKEIYSEQIFPRWIEPVLLEAFPDQDSQDKLEKAILLMAFVSHLGIGDLRDILVKVGFEIEGAFSEATEFEKLIQRGDLISFVYPENEGPSFYRIYDNLRDILQGYAEEVFRDLAEQGREIHERVDDQYESWAQFLEAWK